MPPPGQTEESAHESRMKCVRTTFEPQFRSGRVLLNGQLFEAMSRESSISCDALPSHVRCLFHMRPKSNCPIPSTICTISRRFAAAHAMGGRMAATVKARVGPQNGSAKDIQDIRTDATSGRIRV